MSIFFSKRASVFEVEEGKILQPKFDEKGLIPVITIDTQDKQVLMHGYMNEEALKLSMKTKLAHYWSRSRKMIWKKGETSGFQQEIKKIKIDDDQDCIILFVELTGVKASCHVGYKSCFYRELKNDDGNFTTSLVFTENKKIFDPEKVYKGMENPTKL